MGRFLTRDSWQGDYNTPMSYNAWLYGFSNPINFLDPSGLFPIAGIEVDDRFSQEEKLLISETMSDYSRLLGGEEILRKNLALVKIVIGWTKYREQYVYNPQYNPTDQTITLPYGWYSPIIAKDPNGIIHIALGPPCIESYSGLPKGSLPTNEIGLKFSLAHEMTHALATGNHKTFDSFKGNVDLPWAIFAGSDPNPIIKRNAVRSNFEGEVFADVIAADLYSQGLLNQQMSDWLGTKMPDTLK